LSRSQSRQERENLRHQRQGFIKLGAAGHQHHHRDLKFGGVLLKAQVAVGGQENLEFRLGQREVLADGYRSIMPGQRAAQWMRRRVKWPWCWSATVVRNGKSGPSADHCGDMECAPAHWRRDRARSASVWFALIA